MREEADLVSCLPRWLPLPNHQLGDHGTHTQAHLGSLIVLNGWRMPSLLRLPKGENVIKRIRLLGISEA